MVGDTEVDYEAANNCNVAYYILNREFKNKKYWIEKNINFYDNLYPLLKIKK